MNSSQWLRAFLILLVTCALVATWSVPAMAGDDEGCCGRQHQDRQHGMHKRHRMPTYAELDTDGDGQVDVDEFHAFRAQRMAARTAAGGKMKNAGNAPAFADLDKDGDGNLSAEEFAAHHARCPMHQGDEE